MACGFMNSWGVSSIYIASYLRIHDSTATIQQVDFVLTLSSIAYGCGLVISVWLVDLVGPQLTNLFGTVSMSLGFVISAFVTQTSLFVLIFGLLVGFGFGISFLTGNNVAIQHFRYNRGKVLGFCVSGNGFATVLFGLIFTYIVNPNNYTSDIESIEGSQVEYYFNAEISSRTPTALLATGGIIFFLGCLGSLLIQVRTAPTTLLTDEEESEILSQYSGESELNLTTVGQVIKTALFWKMFAALYCGMSFCMWVFCSYKNFGSIYIESDHFLSFVGVVGSLLNGVSRGLFPFLLDYISFYTVNKSALVFEACLAFTIFYSVQNRLTYMLVVASTFFIQGSQFFPFSLICIHEYGPILGPKVFSYLAWGGIIASAIPGIYYWMTVKTFGYYGSFLIQGIQVLLGLALTFSLNSSSKENGNEVDLKE